MYEELINKIKEKKPLDKLDGNFVKYFIEEFFKRNFKLKKKFSDEKFKSKDFEIVVKNVRNELNRIYGQFWIGDELNLESHKSTKERLEYYDYIYKKIFDITGKPKRILDLGAGLNPLSYKSIKDVYFIATELTDYDFDKIKEIFKKDRIKGEVIKLDLFNYEKLPEADVCFMFKLLDIIETKGHKLAEKLIKDADCKYIVISFSVIDVKGRKMKYPKRMWFEVMVKRLGFNFNTFEISNEIFYVVGKG